jgi:hypothetical protein
MRIRMGSVAMALLLGACAGVSVEVPAEITEFDFEQVMSELRDCDKLSETFVGVVRQMATDLDELSDVSGGRWWTVATSRSPSDWAATSSPSAWRSSTASARSTPTHLPVKTSSRR